MNEGFLQSSSWSSCMNNQAPTSSSSLWHDEYSCQEQELPVSWSQLLLGGSLIDDFEAKKPVDDVGWEDQMAARDLSPPAVAAVHRAADEASQVDPEEIQLQLAEASAAAAAAARASWCQMNSSTTLAVSSPRSCVTTSFGSSNVLDFSSNNSKADQKRHHSSEVCTYVVSTYLCNSKETGAAAKKIRVAPYSAQSTFKFQVRKEKLGDRIAVLHQMVSPFGKTDTASVLLEAIGYIRFLHKQIEVLSSPYLGGGGSDSSTRQHPAVKGRNCIFPEDPGQVDGGSELKDLRSRGLCLVPLSACTSHVGGSAGADHWDASLAAGLL